MTPRPRARRSRPNPGRRGAGSGQSGWSGDPFSKPDYVDDPQSGGLAELRRIQPYQATKTYVCPGCNQEIRPGTGHLVIVPLGDSSARRHWHTPCWEHRARRRPTGR